MSCLRWSGRRDSNSRPPAPKADSGASPKAPVFNIFYFNELPTACGDLLNFGEPGGFRILISIYSRRMFCEGFSVKLEVEIDIAEGTINKHELEERVRKEAIRALFVDRKIPAGHAARELGLGRLEFMELLKPRGIPTAS